MRYTKSIQHFISRALLTNRRTFLSVDTTNVGIAQFTEAANNRLVGAAVRSIEVIKSAKVLIIA
jgi:hypothetical protein